MRHSQIRPERLHSLRIPQEARKQPGWESEDLGLDALVVEGDVPSHPRSIAYPLCMPSPRGTTNPAPPTHWGRKRLAWPIDRLDRARPVGGHHCARWRSVEGHHGRSPRRVCDEGRHCLQERRARQDTLRLGDLEAELVLHSGTSHLNGRMQFMQADSFSASQPSLSAVARQHLA